MVKIKMNGSGYEVPDGKTVLEAAEEAGFHIPTLCYSKGLPHYSSCMVCMVRDRRNNGFIPSCSALVQEGMDLDISGDEVESIRTKAIELLLSEHRAECEAPCKIVCPAGYNIPVLNRMLRDERFGDAIALTLSETGPDELLCFRCAAYCENACRRKKVDNPVSIKNIKIFIYNRFRISESLPPLAAMEQEKNPASRQERKKEKVIKRFQSHTGRVEENELAEWLKECRNDTLRFREIDGDRSASGEAGNCMHCDCRALNDCRLRSVAELYSVKDPRGKVVNAPIARKINITTGLVFENAKCIKCGLCVRLCEGLNEEPSLCFIHRGFVSIISEPLTADFNEILAAKSKEVINICPTGALGQF